MFGGTRLGQGPADRARDSSLDLRLCLSHFCVWGRVSDSESESTLRQKPTELNMIARAAERAPSTPRAFAERTSIAADVRTSTASNHAMTSSSRPASR